MDAENPVLRIILPTPFPVGPVNAYLIRKDPITLVDTGVRSEPSREALRLGLAEAGLKPRDIRRIVITHAHVDHYGLAARLRLESEGMCLAHRLCIDSLREFPFDKTWMRANTVDFLTRHGVPDALAATIAETQAGTSHLQEPLPEIDEALEDGTRLEFDGMAVEVIETPGHHPGHIVLVDHAAGRLFAGDQLLQETRTVPFLALFRWHERQRPRGLAEYLRSLRKIEALAPREVFPGHGGFDCDPGHRIREIIRYHERRRRRVLAQLTGAGCLNAFELCRRMFRNQAEPHAFILMSEIMGQLDLLEEEGEVETVEEGGRISYRSARSAARETTPRLPESGIRLRRNGVWTHQGVEITHEGTIRLFRRSIRRDPTTGRYLLEVRGEKAWIDVEGAPHFVTNVVAREGHLWVQLSDETEEELAPDTLEVGADHAFTCRVKGGEFPARFQRAAHYQLAAWIEEDANGNGYVVRDAGGRLHPIRSGSDFAE